MGLLYTQFDTLNTLITSTTFISKCFFLTRIESWKLDRHGGLMALIRLMPLIALKA
jgi:hypothetical protein